MEVSDVLRDRMREPAGLEQMAAVSALLHAGLVALVLLAPGGWFEQRQEAPREVMTISLAGGGAVDSGGFTSIGGRAVQTTAPPEELKKPEPVRTPAAEAPAMTVPEKTAPRRSGSTAVTQAPDKARGSTPTKGAEKSEGSSLAETGVRGMGFGLSTGGGPGSGSRLDVADFCCPDYVVLMVERIRGNWDQRVETSGVAIVYFVIDRDGRLTNYQVERSSGSPILDNNALRAIARTRQLPPLPAAFPNPNLPVHLTFEYTRR
jgi:protein TonB